ncbi:MAG: antitoxin [Acidobacteria bacterium]|nr:antitoxin [Acidobacteriota bacterium]
MSKLTLSVDEEVVRDAKRYAAARGTSISRLVERYVGLLSRLPKSEDQTPVLRMLRGAARGASADAYREHLDRRYR